MPKNPLLKTPGAWLPVAISFAMTLFIIANVVLLGVVQRSDEGLPARIFQLFMLIQVFIIVYFVSKNLKQRPKQTIQVLIFQILAFSLPVIIISILEI